MHRVGPKKVLCVAVAILTGGASVPGWAQQAAPQYSSPGPYSAPAPSYGTQPQQYGQSAPAGAAAPVLLSQDQISNLVAPIALYPDQLLSQILAASTYPLEIVDAEQWLQQNRNLPEAQRMDTAKQQSWDPSVQALVAFPDILDILGRDVRWTTDLGNAFLAQQSDVMNAIQGLRARAQQSGRLQTTRQQTVTTQTQDGQSAIQIAPADPQYIYPPVYDPYAVWGPPVYGAYPSLWYPPTWGYGGYGSGVGFGVGYFIGGLFSGLLGFGGWGWGLSWFAHSLFFNPLFFSHFGFHGYGGYGGGGYGYHGALVAGHPAWAHDPGHRMGVPYANREVASRFGGRVGGTSAGTRGFAGSASLGARSEVGRGGASEGAWRGVGSSGARAPSTNQFAARATPQSSGRGSFAQGSRSTGGYNSGTGNAGSYNRSAPAQSYRGFSGSSPSAGARPSQSFASPRGQSFNSSPAPNRNQPQIRQQQNMPRSFSAPSAPRGNSSGGFSSGGSSHASAPHMSAPHSSGGGGGGHSGGGGSHSSGGHHK